MDLKLTAIVLGLSVSLVGCQTTSLRDQTASALGYNTNQVTLTNIKSRGTFKYYIAKTPKGEYRCRTENAAGKALVLGFGNGPECEKR